MTTLHNDKLVIKEVMRSHSKFTSDYQDVTILLLISALHNNMVVNAVILSKCAYK